MKTIITIVFVSFAISIFAQNEEALMKINEYGIDEEMLTKNLKDADAEHYFKLKTTSITDSSSYTTLSEFDPSREIGKRWKLLEQNGKKPDEKAIKTYEKNANTKKKDVNGKIDRSSWEILQDDGDIMIFAFRYEEKSLPKRYRFLSDCQGKLYYDKSKGRVTKAEYKNDGPTKVSIFKVDNLNMEVFFRWVEAENAYLIERQEITMQIRVFGQSAESREISEYLDYKRM